MKAEHKELLRGRASEALRDMYHNATPRYPPLDDAGASAFDDWFPEIASFEIDYMQSGGAYGPNYSQCLRSNAEQRYTSPAAIRHYVSHGLRVMAEYQAKGGAWERIAEYGKLYTWGRGGRTLAPDGIVSQRGGSQFGIAEDTADDYSLADLTELIRIVEAFNAYVSAWCECVPQMWDDEISYRADEAASEAVTAANWANHNIHTEEVA